MNVATCVKERGWNAINNFQCEEEAASSWGESEKISQEISALCKALTGPTTVLIVQFCPHCCPHILVTPAGLTIIQVAHKTSGSREALKQGHTP